MVKTQNRQSRWLSRASGRSKTNMNLEASVTTSLTCVRDTILRVPTESWATHYFAWDHHGVLRDSHHMLPAELLSIVHWLPGHRIKSVVLKPSLVDEGERSMPWVNTRFTCGHIVACLRYRRKASLLHRHMEPHTIEGATATTTCAGGKPCPAASGDNKGWTARQLSYLTMLVVLHLFKPRWRTEEGTWRYRMATAKCPSDLTEASPMTHQHPLFTWLECHHCPRRQSHSCSPRRHLRNFGSGAYCHLGAAMRIKSMVTHLDIGPCRDLASAGTGEFSDNK